ncbi:MAG: hypothetical protein ACKO7W_18360 [Elainella sp.]
MAHIFSRNSNATKFSTALLIAGTLIATGLQLLIAQPAWADCITPDGYRVPTGTRIGPYTCMPDGTWQA